MGFGVCAVAIGVCVALLVREEDKAKVAGIKPPSAGAKVRRVSQCGKGCKHGS